tara:strand:+ start:1142 stop:1564 length:423 start_codon:yes stop_codon:yes gene_type:complete
MELKGIVAVTGRPGLFKIISRGNNTIIVENLYDKKRIPITARQQVNSLEEIGIYTIEETVPLADIFNIIAKKEDYSESISHKLDNKELKEYFTEILPNYDKDRVYMSDIKKVILWYNILQKADIIKLSNSEKESKDKKVS